VSGERAIVNLGSQYPSRLDLDYSGQIGRNH
jgi:hypothetical protein